MELRCGPRGSEMKHPFISTEFKTLLSCCIAKVNVLADESDSETDVAKALSFQPASSLPAWAGEAMLGGHLSALTSLFAPVPEC